MVRSSAIPTHVDYKGDEKSSESFCRMVIDSHKKFLVGQQDILPSFLGRTPDGIWGLSFTKEIDTEEDMTEVVEMIKGFFINGNAREVLLLCRGRTIEDEKPQETLLCMLFDRNKSMKLKIIDIYRTEEKSIFGFSESDFSVCEVLNMGEFGIL